MRAALSILGLVIVLAIVMVTMKNQAQQLAASKAAPAATATSSSAAASQPAGALPNPAAVGQQVNELVMQGAARSSDAQP